MSLERCFICGGPVLELEGQFASFAPYQLRADDDAAKEKAFGHCHLACLIGSKWGPFWATRRIEQLRDAQGLRALAKDEITILENAAAGERIAIRADGMIWSYPTAKKKRQSVEGGALFAIDEEWNLELDDPELVARIRRDLEGERRSSLLALAAALDVRDRLLAPEHLEDAHLAYDKELARLWKGGWISCRARYHQFVPEAAL